MRGHRAEGLIRHASRRRGRGWRGAGTRVCRGRSRVRGLDATTTGPQGSARTVLQRARPCGIDEELDGLGLRTGVQGAWRTQPRGRGAAAGKAHLVDVLRRKVFGDGEGKLGLGDVLARLEAIVPLVALERRHVQLREVDRLRQRAGRDSQRRPSENGRPEGQRIGGNQRRVLRVRERAARALGVWARRKRTWSGAPTGTRSGAGATSLELADEGSPCSCLLFLAPCLPCWALRRLDTVGMRSETITVSTCTQRPHRTW